MGVRVPLEEVLPGLRSTCAVEKLHPAVRVSLAYSAYEYNSLASPIL